jgi:hypothetical protein
MSYGWENSDNEQEPDQIDMMNETDLRFQLREWIKISEIRRKELEAKDKELIAFREEMHGYIERQDKIINDLDYELSVNKKEMVELRDLDLNRLLGEAALETMLTNSKLSVQLDSARGVIKRLLTNKEDKS